MAYEVIDGYVCDMDGETCLAKYDFGEAEFKVKFFEYLDSVEKFSQTVASRMKELGHEALSEDSDKDSMVDFLAQAKVELEVSNELFAETETLLGEGFCQRHIEGKSVYRLARAIGELAKIGVEAVGKHVDETESMVNSYVNRAQKRAAARAK